VVDKHEFQAETRQLLDIVARSLYSDHEVFVRELISNASDALEKFRYTSLSAGGENLAGKDRPLEIRITTDKPLMQLIIQDTGIGMTKEELVSNLGTIARSGSKKFLEQMKGTQQGASSEASSNIIGQFGVGFYSSFDLATLCTHVRWNKLRSWVTLKLGKTLKQQDVCTSDGSAGPGVPPRSLCPSVEAESPIRPSSVQYHHWIAAFAGW